MALPPKKQLRRQDVEGTARFLTFSCYRRLRLFDNDRMEDRFVYHLKIALDRHGVRLLAWVVMPEHVHLIVFPETASPLSGLLIAIKRPLATEVLGRWRAVNAPVLSRLRDRGGDVHFWQAGAGTIGT